MKATTSTNPVQLVPAEPPEAPATRPLPRLGLPELDQRAITSLTTGDPVALLEHVRGLAEALAGADAEGCRRRTIARALAATRTQEQLLEEMLGEALGRRDLEAVAAIDLLLGRLTKRLEMLLREHRLETTQQRPAVVVGISAGTVNLGGTRGGG